MPQALLRGGVAATALEFRRQTTTAGVEADTVSTSVRLRHNEPFPAFDERARWDSSGAAS
jgi:hypothetical protein